ncbi:hypothetical protein VPH35_118014 [Triticum aestivum]
MCSSIPFSEAIKILSTSHNKANEVSMLAASSSGEAAITFPVSAQKIYCSGMLEELEDSASNTDSESAEPDEEMVTVEAPIASGLKIMEFMEKTKERATPKNKWGPVVAPRLSSRVHNRQNIMEKAASYKMKQNLEIPPTFKRRAVDKHPCNLGKDQLIATSMEDSLCGRPIGAAEKMHSTPGSAKRRAAQDCVGIGLRACVKRTRDEALKAHSE